ncbi:hypothetical protein ACFX13_004969 [Malus domestica]
MLWRFCACCVLMLLLFSSAEARLLNPSGEKRNVTGSSQALAGSARELLNVWLRKLDEEEQQTVYNPKRLSPGGPDPRHH